MKKAKFIKAGLGLVGSTGVSVAAIMSLCGVAFTIAGPIGWAALGIGVLAIGVTLGN